MKTTAPYYLAVFHSQEAKFCLLHFSTNELAQNAYELLSHAILYDGHETFQASWHHFQPDNVIDLQGKEEDEFYQNAPRVLWQDVILGIYRPIKS